ncbi:unnamed protein product [Oikopleura dioica]|uniref:Uncharacterized protein n=1 Tax=Oikopleura dioica TaxID=34765 RepID=E4WVG1_OIKDI|nr:unnamed protein product [Oikopleura dioica]
MYENCVSVPIFPRSERGAAKDSDPIITIEWKRGSKMFDKEGARIIQSLLSPFSIEAIQFAFNKAETDPDISAYTLFNLIRTWIGAQRKVVTDLELWVDKLRQRGEITQNLVEDWITLDNAVPGFLPSRKVKAVASMLDKTTSILNDPFEGEFCETFKVHQLLDMGDRIVRSLGEIWDRMDEAWTAVLPISPSPTIPLGYSFLQRRSTNWRNLELALRDSQDAAVKTIAFARRDKTVQLLTRMGGAWAVADFKFGRGKWNIFPDERLGEVMLRRRQGERLPTMALVVNIFKSAEEIESAAAALPQKKRKRMTEIASLEDEDSTSNTLISENLEN